MTPGERVAKANRARDLLRELDWLFDEVRDDMVRSLETSALGDVDTHHNLAISLQTLSAIKNKLRRISIIIVAHQVWRCSINELLTESSHRYPAGKIDIW